MISVLAAAVEAVDRGLRLDSAVVGSLATLLTVAVGWYTARVARKGQRESHAVATKEQKRLNAEWIVDASRELAETIQSDLQRIREELEEERKLRETAQSQASRLQTELAKAEAKVELLMERLQQAQEESERLRVEMDALGAELRLHRNGNRTPSTRGRWDDDDDNNKY